MNELRLPPDTPFLYEECLLELCTDRAYEMMSHRKSSLDVDTFNYQIEYWTNKIFQAHQHLRGEDWAKYEDWSDIFPETDCMCEQCFNAYDRLGKIKWKVNEPSKLSL